MDSELTLVNPAPPTSYYLSSTDLRDTVIFSQPAAPLYRITSDTRHIKICDSTTPDRIIAVLHRREFLPDMICFPQRQDRNGTTVTGTQTTLHRWLKRSKLPDGTPACTFNTEFGRYVWKALSRYRQKVNLAHFDAIRQEFLIDVSAPWHPCSYMQSIWQVFAEYDLENPVASCYLHQSCQPNQPALILQSAAEPLRDDIVVCYIIQRHRVEIESKALDLFVGPN